MMIKPCFFRAVGALVALVGLTTTLGAQQTIRLPVDPDLSPDGKRLVFVWRGDLWVAPVEGGSARQLTSSPGDDATPKFSPDGKRIAFVSNREGGSRQVFVVPAGGGEPRQLTFHTDGYDLQQWTPDGKSLLVAASRDHDWRRGNRFFLIDAQKRSPERLVFDAAGDNGRLSPDGKHLLFTREGVAWWRKGYEGSQSSQIWKYDLEAGTFSQLSQGAAEARSPLWAPDGKSYYWVSGQNGAFNLHQQTLGAAESKPLTGYSDDGVVMPCLSADGTTLVFRHLFDLYRMNLRDGSAPVAIPLVCRADQAVDPTRNVTLDSASEAVFSADGLEVAFVAGGDVWVMDTVLREPRQVTRTPELESSPVFSGDGNALFFVSDAGGQSDVWMATRGDAARYWWLNDGFELKQLTRDSVVESDLQLSPAGDRMAFVRGGSGLWLMNPDGSNARVFVESWDNPEYDWSPDGKWIAWSVSDNDFNSDVFVAPVDGSQPPLNISRHPDNDNGPVWSPDGKTIAFTGRRMGEEQDIYFVLLQKSEDEINERDRKLKEALEKLEKGRKDKEKGKPAGGETPAAAGAAGGSKPAGEPAAAGAADPARGAQQGAQQGAKQGAQATQDEPPLEQPDQDKKGPAKPEDGKPEEKKLPEVRVDAEGIHDRLRRVLIPNSGEGNLFWSPDSKRLAFSASIDGKPGTYTIEPPAELTPKLLTAKSGSNPRWLEAGKQIVWLSGGVPESVAENGQATPYPFRALSVVDVAARYQAGFDAAWRAMRDGFYDGNLNNRNWDEIRRKYQAVAREAGDDRTFADVVQLMLGELNGSHLGFFAGGAGPGRRGRGGPAAEEGGREWNEFTAHFGLRYDPAHKGPGLKVRDVIHGSPAWTERSRILPGETVIAIDGTEVDPAMELTPLLNGRPDREMKLKVRNAAGEDREVAIRPISFAAARALLYPHWVRTTQAVVREKSADRFGYVHIQGMDMGSFYEFERDLFAIASGKEGLVIDVRENGGGSTADHLLTVLTQPAHAITVPRGGGPGYPHDRMVYATWNKPIVVLCNQNSFSNAEIFSHAIKTLKRGRLVGVPTAGGVISTGGTQITDLGFLRMPFRGWYLLNDGEDMELNGAVPDFVIWPQPGDEVAGKDAQLEKALAVLEEDVAAWKARPMPKLKKASERPGRK